MKKGVRHALQKSCKCLFFCKLLEEAVRVTPSLKSKNSDEFFPSLLFPSGTEVSPLGRQPKGCIPLNL